MRLQVRILAACLGAGCMAAPRGMSAENRFTAAWSDGTRTGGDEVLGWQTEPWQPTLAGRPLFDSTNPIRWLRDRSIPTADTPDAYVELLGGDRLPGRMVGYERGGETHAYSLPPRLLVEPSVTLSLPDGPRQGHVRVLAEHVRRVVWRRRASDRYQPGTLFYLDGRQLSFRSLRWGRGVVRLLVDDGASEVPLAQIAELHLPVSDPWEAYVAQLAILCPSGAGRLVRLETSGGLVATVSNERFQARSIGAASSPDPNQWLHVAQPAWSLDPFYLRHRSIRLRQFFAAHELPLTWLNPARGQQRPSLAPARVGRIDRNVEGGSLTSGGADYAWGLGVHAHYELEFALPACVRGFSTRVGLDQLAGRGGCARARIFMAPLPSAVPAPAVPAAETSLLYESPALVGSAKVCDSGLLPITGPARLILVADSVERDRPVGADPLDIRDTFDWLEPRLLLDPAALGVEIRHRLPSKLVAWRGWQVTGIDDPGVGWTNRWQADDQGSYSFRLCMRPAPVLTVSRRLRVAPGQDCLVIAVERAAEGTSPAQIEVRLDGRSAGRFEVPVRASAAVEPDPLVVYLHAERGRELAIDLVPTASDQNSWIDWRGLGLVTRPSRIHRWFEDEPRFLAGLPHGDSQAKLVRDDKFSGTDCVRLTPGERSNASYPGLRLPIRYQPRPGEYRYLRFAWRKRGGGRICVQLAHDGRFGPDPRPAGPDALLSAPIVEMPEGRGSFRYDAGAGPPSLGAALRVDEQPLADHWQVVTRDLYADFGGFELTGISLVVPDGKEALFDHIYLARSLDDFQWIDRELAAERAATRLLRLRRFLPSDTRDPAQARRMVEAFSPGFMPGALGEAGLALVEEHQGRGAVLRTSPSAADQPCRLSSVVDIALGRKTRLYVSVAHEAGQDGRLMVTANGQTLVNAAIDASTSKDGWSDLVVDLTQFAGQKFGVALQIERFGRPGQPTPAYWSRVEVLTE
ncbi:MAG TPA: NPCBM/NEW2 domain-containing protein [Pirellulales bacterium]|nr:NPCBM/NEW2 domain-containing protein [Pirellulales bacterium]